MRRHHAPRTAVAVRAAAGPRDGGRGDSAAAVRGPAVTRERWLYLLSAAIISALLMGWDHAAQVLALGLAIYLSVPMLRDIAARRDREDGYRCPPCKPPPSSPRSSASPPPPSGWPSPPSSASASTCSSPTTSPAAAPPTRPTPRTATPPPGSVRGVIVAALSAAGALLLTAGVYLEWKGTR